MDRIRASLVTLVAVVLVTTACASQSVDLVTGESTSTTTTTTTTTMTSATTTAASSPSSTAAPDGTGGRLVEEASLDLSANRDDFDFWAWGTAAVDEVEYYRSIDEMADAATAVVIGRVVDAIPARVLATDTPEDVFRIERFAIEIDHVVLGELPVGGPKIVFEPNLAGATDDPPPSRALLFLRHKGENQPPGDTSAVAVGDRAAYRLVSAQGVLIELDGTALNPSAVYEKRNDPVNTDAAGRTLAEIVTALTAD